MGERSGYTYGKDPKGGVMIGECEMLAPTHIANQVLAKCSLQNANAKCVHPPILRACKDAKCVHKAYCILAILAECMRSCKNAIWQHS